MSNSESNRYFVRLNLEDRIAWEEVDKTVFDRREEALDNSGNARYENNDYIILNSDEAMVACHYSGPLTGMTLVMRMLSVKPFDGKLDKPIWENPTHIKFKTKLGALWMYELETQQLFKINKPPVSKKKAC